MNDHPSTVAAVMSDIVMPAIEQLPSGADIEVLTVRREQRLRILGDETIPVIEFDLTLQSHGHEFHDVAYANIVGVRTADPDEWVDRLVSDLREFLASTGAAWGEIPGPRQSG